MKTYLEIEQWGDCTYSQATHEQLMKRSRASLLTEIIDRATETPAERQFYRTLRKYQLAAIVASFDYPSWTENEDK